MSVHLHHQIFFFILSGNVATLDQFFFVGLFLSPYTFIYNIIYSIIIVHFILSFVFVQVLVGGWGEKEGGGWRLYVGSL